MFKNEQEYEYNVNGFFVGSNFVLYHDKLSDKAKLLYMHITNRYNFFLYANQVKTKGVIEEVKEVYCESQATMATALGYSEKSKTKVNPLIKMLEEEGLLLVIKKHDGKNSNWYIPLTKEGQPNITVPIKGVSVMYKELPDINREERVTKKPKEETHTQTPDVVKQETIDTSWGSVDDFDDFDPFTTPTEPLTTLPKEQVTANRTQHYGGHNTHVEDDWDNLPF